MSALRPISTAEERTAGIGALRELADILEAAPHVPMPTSVSWHIGFSWEGTELDRFNRLHDVADALGRPVIEKPDDRSRRMELKVGSTLLYATAEADKPEAERGSDKPRLVQRPAPAEPEPFVQATPAEVADAYEHSARHGQQSGTETVTAAAP